jgi:hypothetical protein
MLFHNNDLMPRTYAVKGYRKRRTISLKALLLCILVLLGLSAAVLVIFMTMRGLI